MLETLAITLFGLVAAAFLLVLLWMVLIGKAMR